MISHRYRAYGFSSTHKVLEAEDALKEAGIPVRTIPRPASLGGAECGIVVRVGLEDVSAAEKTFEQRAITPAASIQLTDISE